MAAGAIAKGQRWISESEPELGVGVVVDTAPDRIFLFFRATNTLRQYAAGSAPIKRVEFGIGDRITLHSGETHEVTNVEKGADSLFLYTCGKSVIPETELSDTLTFSGPEERLLIGQVSTNEAFELRYESHRRRHQVRHSPVRGFVGGRIDLIPHQLYVAQEAASRLRPRVLLSDEVGLGKTIEAGLILHRLVRSGRVGRCLILVPSPLIHQWFVELLRRFNLLVSIYDEERCVAIESGEEGTNPFLDEQIILCPVDLLVEKPQRALQATEAGWDLLIVDEAHHLAWSPTEASPQYAVVENLANQVEGLILLTATPEQLGEEGHFARLRLLDPDRYGNLERFLEERKEYQKTAQLAASLTEKKPLSPAQVKSLRSLKIGDASLLEKVIAGDDSARQSVLEELLDRHGPGRVMFRNTRNVVKGFPKRKAFFHEVPAVADRLLNEWKHDNGDETATLSLKGDPRIEWLLDFLSTGTTRKKKAAPDKVLLICRTREKALALEQQLKTRVNLKIALFHEELSLLQRDRNAAWFAEPDGASLLICSEIGSEGRNFQFAHHLVLFDLPLDPDLLEQRIGRLDRIGQKQDISLHIPAPKGSVMELLAAWHHEGLHSFEKTCHGGQEILTHFRSKLEKLIAKPGKAGDLSSLLKEVAAYRDTIRKKLEKGQDLLLQMNSFRPERAKSIVEQIRNVDGDEDLEEYLQKALDHLAIPIEELAPRTYRIVPPSHARDVLPGLTENGLSVTADRQRALSREDIGFLSWDHPLITGAIDTLVAGEEGNTAFAVWNSATAQAVYLEAIFILEPIAPKELQADRFLPPTPVRVVIDVKGEDVSGDLSLEIADLREGSIFTLLDNPRIKRKLVPAMVQNSRDQAAKKAAVIIESSLSRMKNLLGGELERLKDLQKVNDHISDKEVESMASQIENLTNSLKAAPIRLDALRLIWRVAAATLDQR